MNNVSISKGEHNLQWKSLVLLMKFDYFFLSDLLFAIKKHAHIHT
jgi:hypothetical protein